MIGIDRKRLQSMPHEAFIARCNIWLRQWYLAGSPDEEHMTRLMLAEKVALQQEHARRGVQLRLFADDV